MVVEKISKEEYLDKNFDYTKLTKQELRQIMSENNVPDIPNLTALKSVILDAYKANIYDKIDELRGKFSKENIFQNEKKKSRKGNESLISDSLLNTQDDISNLSNVNSSIANQSLGERSGINRSINQSTIGNTTDLSSVINKSFNQANTTLVKDHEEVKFKTPFIAIPKKPSSTTPTSMKKTSKFRKFLNFCFLIFVLLCTYLKFFCPYCRPDQNNFICIPIPPHTSLVGDRLVVDEGYRLIRSVIDYCIPDNHLQRKIQKQVSEYITLLENLKGDFLYGFAKSPRISGTVITDPNILDALLKSGRVILNNGMLEAKQGRVTVKSFTKFYFYFLVKISLTLSFLLIFIKIYLKKRRNKKQLLQTATTVSKEVLETLNRQIMMSIKSSQFKPYVLSVQIRDALEIKPEVWNYVEQIVSKNSNVEKSKDANGQILWRWIGPVLYKNNESIEFQ